MADSSANSIARKCRKLESTMVMVKSDQAGTPDKSKSHSPNFMRQWSSWLCLFSREGEVIKEMGPTEGAATSIPPASKAWSGCHNSNGTIVSELENMFGRFLLRGW